jgi:hypothetical protein
VKPTGDRSRAPWWRKEINIGHTSTGQAFVAVEEGGRALGRPS